MSTHVAGGSSPVRPDSPTPAEWRRLALVVVGLVGAVALMLLAFLAPIVSSGAHHLPVAMAGPYTQTDAITDAISKNDPDALTSRPTGARRRSPTRSVTARPSEASSRPTRAPSPSTPPPARARPTSP